MKKVFVVVFFYRCPFTTFARGSARHGDILDKWYRFGIYLHPYQMMKPK